MSCQKHRFIMVLPYFAAKKQSGEVKVGLPPFFKLWAWSLARVKMDVLLVTDMSLTNDLPSNLRMLKMSLSDLRELAQNKLRAGEGVALTHPRKLCDLKPFYGLIFEDYLLDYEYWGFGDCDLVYGRKMNEVLHEITDGCFDVASLKPGRISGGLTFVRNTPELRCLALRIDDWQVALADERYFLLDEIRNWLRFGELDSGHCTLEDIRREDGDCFSAVVWRAQGLRIYDCDKLCEKRQYFYSCVKMKQGRLTFNGHEIAAFHYVRIKSFPYFDMDSANDIIGEDFVIDSNGFHNSLSLLTFVRESRVIACWFPVCLWRHLKHMLHV